MTFRLFRCFLLSHICCLWLIKIACSSQGCLKSTQLWLRCTVAAVAVLLLTLFSHNCSSFVKGARETTPTPPRFRGRSLFIQNQSVNTMTDTVKWVASSAGPTENYHTELQLPSVPWKFMSSMSTRSLLPQSCNKHRADEEPDVSISGSGWMKTREHISNLWLLCSHHHIIPWWST